MNEIVLYVAFVLIQGLIGAFTHWLVEAYAKKDYTLNKDFVARLLFGVIAVYIYAFVLYLPDSLNYFLVGYFSISFIKNLVRGLRYANRNKSRFW